MSTRGLLKSKKSARKIGVDQLNDQDSSKKGFFKLLENFARTFKDFFVILFLTPIAALYIFCIGFALLPGAVVVLWIFKNINSDSLFLQGSLVALGLAFGIVTFIPCLLFIVPVVNFPIKFFVKPFRGPWFSLESIAWFYHNALMYLVRYTVLDLATPTPLSIFFLKGMGMKIGKNCVINTSNISDPCLIELGDYVTIGGSVYMMAHYGMNGYLIIDKLVVKRKANIGLHAYLMGAVVVGEGAKVLPNTTVLPKTEIPDGSRYPDVA